LELLDFIDEKGTATRWDLIKILGNTDQFRHWIEEFLLKEKLLEERQEANRYWYYKTETGELFHKLLKNSRIIKAFLRVSGKRLRRDSSDW
jgi:hypothetical protein